MKEKDPQKPTKPKETRQHTSVNLSCEHLARLEQEAVAAQVTMNHLMVLLLRYAAQHNRSMAQKNRRISYQKRGPEYKKVNLYLSLRDYERNQDMRRFYKMSVSFQLAYAIDHYMVEVLQKIRAKKLHGYETLNIYLSPNAYVLTERENRLLFRSIWRPFRE
jgi:hypothetical protein